MLKLSVILPTLNGSQSLRVALRSLAGQTLPREQYEVIVVNDGSTDDTGQVLAEPWPFQLSVIQQENRGAVASRNRAAASARGALLVFVDDDMTLDAHFLEATLALHSSAEERVGIGSSLPDKHPVSAFHRIFTNLCADEPPLAEEAMIPAASCATNNLSVRREVFLRIGGFRDPAGDGPGTWSDVEFGMRAARAGVNCWRSGRALCVHRDRHIETFESALERSYYVASLAPALLRSHPTARIPMLRDKGPIAWREDNPGLILRKGMRWWIALFPLAAAIGWAAQLSDKAPFLRGLAIRLYHWRLGAAMSRGLRDGLSRRQHHVARASLAPNAAFKG